MKKTIVKRFTQFVNENHLDNTIDIGRKAVATAYSGNSNEEMLRLTFSHMPDKEVLISLDSLANVLDPSVLDSTSDEDQEAINKALWTRAQEIAKLAGCVALIDNESDEEIDLTGRDSNSGDSDSSMDKDSRDRRNINEGDNPAHNLLRDVHQMNKDTGRFDPKYADYLNSRYNKLTADDRDRFGKVAMRTKDSRQNEIDDVNQRHSLTVPAYYRNNPKKLLHILEDEYFTPGSQLAAEIVDEFVNDDSMTIAELAQTVSSSDTHRGGSPERITNILTMYAK